MLNTNDNRARVKIAEELLKNVRAREARETHSSLQENVATLVNKRAEERLARKCNGDDDREFYATEDKIVDETWRLIEQAISNLLN